MSFASIILNACDIKGHYAPEYPPQDSVCEFFDRSENVPEFWLNIDKSRDIPDVKLKIPFEYMGRFTRQKYQHNDGVISLWIRMSDFAPYSEDAQRKGIKQDLRPYGKMLIKHPTDLTRNLAQKTKLGEQEIKYLLGTEPKSLPGEPLPKLVGKFGSRDVYYDYDGDIVTDLIPCERIRVNNNFDVREPNLSCKHFVSERLTSFSISYDKDFLSEHKRIRQSALEFLECAFIESE